MAKRLGFEKPRRVNGKVWVNTFFPPYPSVAFDRFLGAVFERKRVPFSVYFAVTDICPYRCPHCSYGNHAKGRLDTVGAKDIIRQIDALGTTTIGFTGGEPLLRDDIVELIEAAGDMSTVMFTTGHRLTDELASNLKNAGLDCLMIGLESDDGERHDKIRGVAGSFDEGLGAIETSLKAGLYTAISTVASRDKINDGTIERLAKFANTHAVHELRVLEPVPTGNLQAHAEQLLTPAESRKMYDFHVNRNRGHKHTTVACFAYLESDDMFGCGAGYHHLFIDALGNVCPCDLTPLSMGNALAEPLADIWARMSKWFDKPRCGCFMKQLYEDPDTFKQTAELPLDTESSATLCSKCPHDDKLPRVYENLFKGRKREDQSGNRK